MEAGLKGFGKEARKLLERYKKASRTQIKSFVEGINLSYIQYEEELKQIMIEYETVVGTEGVSVEEALTDFESKLRSAFEEHCGTSAENKENTIAKLIEIADEYTEIGTVFRKVEEVAPEPIAKADTPEQAEDTDAEGDVIPTESPEA